MLGTRVIVGFLLAVGAFFVIVRGSWIYFVVMAVLATLGLLDYYRITRPYRPAALAGIVGLVLMLYFGWWGTPLGVLGALALALALAFALVATGGPRQGVTARVAITAMGPLWVGMGFACLLLMRRLEAGMSLAMIVVFGTWAGDTFAYFVGRYFGATQMAPRLSPKTTWEGSIAGLFGSVVGAVLLCLSGMSIAPMPPVWHFAVLGVMGGVAGQLGDLSASMIKRFCGIKDFGTVFPGHGGMMDRLDSVIFVSYVLFGYCMATGLLWT